MKLTDIFKQDPLAVLKERGLYEDALQAFEAERNYYKISQAHQQDYLMIVQLVARANPNIADMLLLTSVMQQPAGHISLKQARCGSSSYEISRRGTL